MRDQLKHLREELNTIDPTNTDDREELKTEIELLLAHLQVSGRTFHLSGDDGKLGQTLKESIDQSLIDREEYNKLQERIIALQTQSDERKQQLQKEYHDKKQAELDRVRKQKEEEQKKKAEQLAEERVKQELAAAGGDMTSRSQLSEDEISAGSRPARSATETTEVEMIDGDELQTDNAPSSPTENAGLSFAARCTALRAVARLQQIHREREEERAQNGAEGEDDYDPDSHFDRLTTASTQSSSSSIPLSRRSRRHRLTRSSHSRGPFELGEGDDLRGVSAEEEQII